MCRRKDMLQTIRNRQQFNKNIQQTLEKATSSALKKQPLLLEDYNRYKVYNSDEICGPHEFAPNTKVVYNCNTFEEFKQRYDEVVADYRKEKGPRAIVPALAIGFFDRTSIANNDLLSGKIYLNKLYIDGFFESFVRQKLIIFSRKMNFLNFFKILFMNAQKFFKLKKCHYYKYVIDHEFQHFKQKALITKVFGAKKMEEIARCILLKSYEKTIDNFYTQNTNKKSDKLSLEEKRKELVELLKQNKIKLKLKLKLKKEVLYWLFNEKVETIVNSWVKIKYNKQFYENLEESFKENPEPITDNEKKQAEIFAENFKNYVSTRDVSLELSIENLRNLIQTIKYIKQPVEQDAYRVENQKTEEYLKKFT